ncbi:hypothetical protein SLS56_007685 [Neofusicoccum ribis]|uniref:GPI anchored protein n=1 Tax=Neofusicoccum ribis TaxID=45134 RepID=A0ABR3SMA2_9PEZI
MQFKALALLSALAVIGSAQDIDNNDVPTVCRSLCQSTIDLTTQCDRQNDDDDSGYINCVCSASNASSFVPACEACVAANDEADNEADKRAVDVRDIVRSCSFSSTTWNSASTGTATSGTASITPANSVTVVTTDSTGATVTSTSSASTGSSTGSSATGQVTVTASAFTTTAAAAPAATAGLGGLAVALLAGVPAFL